MLRSPAKGGGAPTSPTSAAFLEGGGEMGALTRAFDWAATPLGAPQAWPQSLRTTVRLLLTSRHPMFIWWGPELIQFYNDAYRQTMGPERHPSALGQRGRECWAEIWDIIGPQIEFVMAGKGATWHEDQLVPVTRFGSRKDVWWTYGYSPIDDGSGGVGGVLVVCNDVTERNVAMERIQALFQQAPGFIAVLKGPDHVFEIANRAYRELVAQRPVIGKPVREALPEIVAQGFVELLDMVFATGQPYVARARPLALEAAGGALETRYLDFVYQPTLGNDGEVTGIFVQGHDVTDQVRALEHGRLLTSELEHRVNNTLAMIGAIVNQTFRSAASTDDVKAILTGRIVALKQAHEILTRASWREASLRAVVEGVLAPHQADARHVQVSGPDITLSARHALSLSLALHELATNAMKYGALSVDSGRVSLSWRLDEPGGERRFHLKWQETGGPPVAPPRRRGFGSRLIEKTLAADFGGEVRIRYEPSGVVCELSTPLERLQPGVGARETKENEHQVPALS